MKLGASLPVGVSPADAKRAAFGAAFTAWMAEAGLASTDIRTLCSVSAPTVAQWRSGRALPSEQHLHTLERAGFRVPQEAA